MIVVGSRAAGFHIQSFRKPKDWDFILPLREIFKLSVEHEDKIKFLIPKNEWKFQGKLKTGESFEIEVADYNPSAMFLWERRPLFPSNGTSFLDQELHYPDLQYLTKMKRSHLYWPVHWFKSMSDYQTLKLMTWAKELEFNEDHDEFYRLRLKENIAKWGESKTNLNMSNEDFFAKSAKIGRTFEHDELHEAVKYYDIPLYQMCKVDHSKASVDACLFALLDREQQERLVREEAMAIALERVLIPKLAEGHVVNSKIVVDAYRYALRRICTNLTSGWFRDFAIEHWLSVNDPDVDYWGKFKEHFKL